MTSHTLSVCFVVTALSHMAFQLSAQETGLSDLDVAFSPEELGNLKWLRHESVVMNITCNSTWGDGVRHIQVKSDDPDVAYVKGTSSFAVNCSVAQLVQFQVYGAQLGHAQLRVMEHIYNGGTSVVHSTFQVTVENNKTILNDVFIVVVAIMVIILSFGFGCRINVNDIKEILKKPVAPAIGLCCQFLLMPLLGIALTQVLRMDEVLGFGLFVVSCSPGGGGSNVWTVLLDGDLELSMTMTFFSKTLALGTMPLWLFAAGRLYGDISVSIPYRNLIIGLFSIAVPCVLGMALRWWKPKAADFVSNSVKILSVFFLLWLIIVGSIANYYVYFVMVQRWYILPASMMLPYLGVFVGGLVALLFRQPRARIVTIAIETGVQDTGVAILLLLSSFGRPDGSIAAAIPIAAAIFTPLPFAFAALAIFVRQRCWLGGKCRRCGGPDGKCDVSTEDFSEGIGLRANSNESDVAHSGQERFNCDVTVDNTSYLDDAVSGMLSNTRDVTKRSKNGITGSSKTKQDLYSGGDSIELNSNKV